MIQDTELKLSFWRDGSTKAERLAAAALRLSGYEEIDPQSPLGGPDGKKDILCQKGGIVWVGAVYFPTGPTRFSIIKKKYQSDIDGMPRQVLGFVFVTNQNLSPTQRSVLLSLAKSKGKEADILHLQQLQNLLDSAPGYGIRIQYLGIGMNIEEQLAWAVDSDSQTAKALSANTRELLALRASLDRMNVGQSHIIKTLGLSEVVTASTPDLISVSRFEKSDNYPPISNILNPEFVLLVHRLICFDLPSRAVGQLRTDRVWLGMLDGRIAEGVQPPPSDRVEALLTGLCDAWRQQFGSLRTHAAKLEAIAIFHTNFLALHPFVDGNGRVARALLMQQCLDLFGKADMSMMNRGADYYTALESADRGFYDLLISLIGPVVQK